MMEDASFDICNICEASIVDPRILPCAHRFCLKCLESSTASEDRPKCPTCLIEFEIPGGGLKDLKVNEFIEQMNNLKQNNISCDSCKENEAIKFCVGCSLNYCSTCLVPHYKVPTSSKHVLQQAKDGINIVKYPTCKQHLKIMTLFCESCKLALCDHCLSKHEHHKLKHLSNFFKSVKDLLNHELEFNEEILRVNAEISTLTDRNDSKASNLRRDLQRKNEKVKTVLDAMVARTQRNIDEELRRCQKAADDLKDLQKTNEARLNAEIETLRQQVDDLTFENVVELSPKFERVSESSIVWKRNMFETCQQGCFEVPKLLNEVDQLGNDFDRMLKILWKGPNFEKVRDDQDFKCSFASVAVLKNGDVCFCENLWGESKVNVFSHDVTNLKTSYDLKDELFDILAINDAIYFAGRSDGVTKIFKIDFALNTAPSKIFELQSQGHVLRLSKSCDDNILLTSSNRIIHLSENGDVLKSVDLNRETVYDALQLDETRYVVCGEATVQILSNHGSCVETYSPSDECQKINCPFRLAKDFFDNVYVSCQRSRCIYVLDRELNFKKRRDVGCCVDKMYFDETKMSLLILTDGRRLLEFDL